jgi:curli production assembly/transport component CsgG
MILGRNIILFSLLILAACTPALQYSEAEKNQVNPVKTLCELENIPAAYMKTSIAVYDFPDLTGAFKSNDAFAVYSKAVPQGADTIVIDALLKAGNGTWFNVVERKGLNSIIQERKISEVNANIIAKQPKITSQAMLNSIQNALQDKNVSFKVSKQVGDVNIASQNPLKMNPQVNFGLQNQDVNMQSLPPENMNLGNNNGNQLLQNADYLITGGIVGYDSDEVTGGGGLKLLNIGGFGEIRKDIVTVNVRLVSVKTGSVVLNTTLSKGIYSQKIQGSSFGYVDVDKILETEVGYSKNEPVFEALNLTIQTAILDIIKQGVARKLWAYNIHSALDNECSVDNLQNNPVQTQSSTSEKGV